MKNSIFWWLVIGITLIGVVFGVILVKPHVLSGTVIDPAIPAPDFTLPSSQGGEYQLSDQTGKFVLIFFGYTHCPDVCPTTLYEMKEIKARLKDKADNIEFVFITVDPDRDTQEQLANFLSSFDESFFGLSGTQDQLEQVWNDYGVYREIQEVDNSLGYLVNHTSRLYLVNSKNELMVTYLNEATVDEITADLKYLMKQGNS